MDSEVSSTLSMSSSIFRGTLSSIFFPGHFSFLYYSEKETFNGYLKIVLSLLMLYSLSPIFRCIGWHLKSPHYRAFSLLPLLFTVLFYLWGNLPWKDWRRVGIEIVLGVVTAGAIIAAAYAPFSDWLNIIPGKWIKSVFIAVCLVFLLYYFIKRKELRLFAFVGVLLIFRLAFNLFVNPQRVEEQMKFPRLVDHVQQIVGDKPISIAGSYPAGFYDPITYPFEVKRNEILHMASTVEPDSYYLMDEKNVERYQPEVLMDFPFTYADLNQKFEGKMFLVKTKE